VTGAVVRRAGAADLPVLAALRRAWAAEQAGGAADDPGFDERFAGWASDAAGERLFWLALEAGRAVGMANLLVYTRMPKPGRPAGRWGYVANVYVDADHRDLGVGGRIMEAVVGHARSAGFVRLVLSPSRPSVPFYARAGFVPASSLMVLEL
jgi:GNAT superfamily N-acetyltransferase